MRYYAEFRLTISRSWISNLFLKSVFLLFFRLSMSPRIFLTLLVLSEVSDSMETMNQEQLILPSDTQLHRFLNPALPWTVNKTTPNKTVVFINCLCKTLKTNIPPSSANSLICSFLSWTLLTRQCRLPFHKCPLPQVFCYQL